jgi:hypothetical protein
MMDAGLDVRTIMEISGHSSLAMLERYTHPTEQRKAEALNTYAMGYLRVTRTRVGLHVNFNVPVLKQGIRRVVL